MINYIKLKKNIENLFKDDIYYLQMKNLVENLSLEYLMALENNKEILDLDNSFKYKLSYTEVLKQACKFLKEYNVDYYDMFKKVYKAKHIHVDLKNKKEAYCDFKNGHGVINWPIIARIDDSFSLIHEFIHYLNTSNKVSMARDYLTETFSILFEFLLMNYLEKNNYKAYEDILKIGLLRFSSGYEIAYELYNNDIIDVYKKNKTINNKVVSNYYDDQELTKHLKEECKMYSDEIPFFIDKKYLFGIYFACDIYNNILEDESYFEKVCFIINNINEMQLKESLAILDIHFTIEDDKFNIAADDYKRITNNFRKQLNCCIKKYKDVKNEEDYSDSRTNRRR